jgi:glycosyltransferase involved in cell wall biosynthesis
MSSPPPLVSVIVPAFNAAAYLDEALESLLGQTLRDIEILVIDDGSTDGTSGILARYARDVRIRILGRDTSSGRPACARNEGLRQARGTYIAFHDADDVACPHWLDRSLDAIRLTNATLSFADYRNFDEATGVDWPVTHFQNDGIFERAERHLEPATGRVFRCLPSFADFQLDDVMVINIQTIVFRRTLLDSEPFGFDESLVGGEDRELFYRLMTRADACLLNEVHARRRLHDQNLTSRQHDRCVADGILARHISLNRQHGRLNAGQVRAIRRRIARDWLDLGYERWRDGRARAAREAYWNALAAAPSKRTAFLLLKTLAPRQLLLTLARAVGAGPR